MRLLIWGTAMNLFEIYAKADRTFIDGEEGDARWEGLTDALIDIRYAAAAGISWLKPETERERDIFIQVLYFHEEDENADALRRMHLVLSEFEPVSRPDWLRYLDTVEFFRRIQAVDNEACGIVKRMHDVICGRLGAEWPSKAAAQPAEAAAERPAAA